MLQQMSNLVKIVYCAYTKSGERLQGHCSSGFLPKLGPTRYQLGYSLSKQYMINEMILILILLIFRSLMAMSLMVYIYQLIRFARASSHVTDFNNRNKFLTAKLLKQGYRYHKLRKAFSKFYRRHFELIEKCHVSLKKTYATRYL